MAFWTKIAAFGRYLQRPRSTEYAPNNCFCGPNLAETGPADQVRLVAQYQSIEAGKDWCLLVTLYERNCYAWRWRALRLGGTNLARA